MTDEVNFASNGTVWSAILTAGLAYMGFFVRKRDDTIDKTASAVTALELKVAENYATKTTVLALFQEAASQTKEAVARVEKSVEATNTSVGKLDLKIDKVSESIGTAFNAVMKELSNKT